MTNENQSDQEKGIVVLPQRALRTIDRHRDRLSRAAFIEACLNALLEEGVPDRAGEQSGYSAPAERPGGEEGISYREFEEFKKNIKELQRAYIDLLLTITVEPAARASKEERERLTQRVRGLLEEQ